MANYISKINIAGVVYDIYDKEARDLLAKTLVFVGVTTTAVSDGATTPATYGGLIGITIPPGHTAADALDAGTVVIYNQKEFVWDGSKWAEFGDLSDLSLSTTTGNFVTGVTATPTNTATNTGAGTSHRHTIPRDSITNLLSGQFMSVVQTTAGVWEPDSNNAITVVSPQKNKLVTDTVTNWTAATAKNVATTGTAVGVFNSITSTQGTDGIKVITDVSGGGQAGEVITEGVAAVLAPTVATGLLTSDATATGRIAYTAGVTATNKMVTSTFTPVTFGDSVNAVTGIGSSGAVPILTNVQISGASTYYLEKVSQYAVSNSDGTNTFTLNLASGMATGYTSTTNSWGAGFKYTEAYLTTTQLNQLTYATPFTYATGALATNGSGSAVATGGTTSYLYLSTTTQTTNTPTVVSFGTVVINGTPSYIHTSNIVPAVANGTIVGLNTSATKTFATGSLASNGSGSSVVYDIETSEMAFIDYEYTSLTFPVFSLSTNDAIGIAYINGTKDATVYTASESAHTHSYSKVTAISVSASTASAITSVSLTPATSQSGT